MKIAVISSDYPGPDLIYGDTFVHTRVKQYKAYCDVIVLGYNPSVSKDRIFKYEGISVHITNQLDTFLKKTTEYNPDALAIHLLQWWLIDPILSFQKPLFIFVHGYEALSWRRRLMNYTALGDLRYLWPYYQSNKTQLKAMKALAARANQTNSIHFIFVSSWLKQAVESDLQISIKNSHIIPNGIDTTLFTFQTKPAELRKKILLLRSFKARNYSNDLAIDAILLLSKKNFFNELDFSVFGEGYLFTRLTKKVKHLPNVQLNNFFVENKSIPAIHAGHGIFLCPSRLDTQGVSMCEAMSSGLVPVTSPVGGIPEYASDGISSFQVQTAQEIANRIEFLYNHPEVFSTMSARASQQIVYKCSLPDTVQREYKLFKSIVDPDTSINFQYHQCTRCVLDTHDDPEITFDDKGVCSYCRNYELAELKYVSTGKDGEEKLNKVIEQIKESGKGKSYDCIIGLSGGVDSTYLAYQVKKFGLRPLAVHFDNGWNSELAVNNIENIIDKLGLDLHTFVVDWDEFRDLQLSFLKASVVDIELITDHAIITKLYQLALQYNIKFVLSGSNVVTEAILPSSWIHDKRDHVNIRAIQKQFGSKPIKTFPLFTSSLKWKVIWKGIKSVSLLDLMPYNKEEVKKVISKELGWRDYGGKHYESVFTRFYQGYILPTKFGVDKRKAHLSNLICSGQLTREEALQELKKPVYDEAMLQSDYQFVLKKLGLSIQEFETIMKIPVKKHTDYPVEPSIYDRFPLLKVIRPAWKKIKYLRNLK